MKNKKASRVQVNLGVSAEMSGGTIMTIEELKKAYADGKTVQFRLDGKGWVDWEDPSFDCAPCEYRVKPDTKGLREMK